MKKYFIKINNQATLVINKMSRNRKNIFDFSISFFLLISLFFSPLLPLVEIAEAAINKQINYQGKLTNSANVAVPNTSYSIVFSLYTVPTGGTAIWSETRSVTTRDGLFSEMLGDGASPLTSVNFNQTLYLGVKVGADAEMTPRKKIGAVPAAFVSEKSANLIGGNSTTLLGSIPYQSNTDTTTLLSPNTTTTKKFLRMTGTGTNGAVPAWDTLLDSDIPSALTGKTYNGMTLSALATGFSIAGGVISKTLTVTDTASISGTNTGDETQATIKTKLGAAAAGVDGYLTGTDWSTFNSKQPLLTNPVTGTGTINYIPKFTSTGSAIGNSLIFDNGTGVGIGTTEPGYALDVNTDIFARRYLAVGNYNNNYPGVGSWALTVQQSNKGLYLNTDVPSNATTGMAMAFGVAGESYSRATIYSTGAYGIGPGSTTRDVFLGRSAVNTFKIGSSYDLSGTANLIVTGKIGIGNTSPSELLTLGTAGTTAGVISLAGATSGKAIIQTGAAAGTPTLTLPTTTGTLALTSDIPTQVYPGAGIAVSTGSAWGTSITDNSTNWNTAYSNRIATFTTTGNSGSATFSSNTLNIPTYTLSGLGGQPIDADLTAIAALAGTSGFLKKTAADTWALDTNTYLTGNQTITLTGDVTGSGTTSIATTIAANSVALSTDTTGDYVSTITGSGTITSSGATTGESIAHTLSVTADSIGDTQLAFNTGQHLTTTSSPTFAGGTYTGIPAFNGGTTGSTAPFTVDSTYLVTNLNADLLDGHDTSYFQTALTNPVTGTGTTNYLPKFTGTSAIGNSQIFDNGTGVGIGTNAPSSKLDIRDGNVSLTDIDVVHGMTGYFNQYNYGVMGPISPTTGGLNIMGVSDTDAEGINLRGIIGTATPSAVTPAINLRADKQSGTTIGSLGATDTVLGISNNSSRLVSVLGSGNVGIGLTNPTSELHVRNISTSPNYLPYEGTITLGNAAAQSAQGLLGRFQNSGDITLGTSYYTYLGNNAKHVAGEDYLTYSKGNGWIPPSAIYVGGDGKIGFLTSQVGGENNHNVNVTLAERMTVLRSGFVGIGNTAPSELLTLGTAGTTAGTISLAGATSGKAIIQTGTAAGTPILTLPTTTGTLALTSNIGTWGALNYPTWSSGTPFVKMTAAGTFALDTNTYLTSSTGVTTFSGGTTGLTPSSATSGAITLAGTLAVANGGTGATTGTTINGTGITYGTTNTITAAAGTLTGTTLNGTVTGSSLTSVGTLTGLTMGGNIALGSNTLTTTNTTKVANLNADLLDGIDSSLLLAQRGMVVDGTDLDTVTTSGMYQLGTGSQTYINPPVASPNGHMIVYNGGNNVTQEYYESSGGSHYKRTKWYTLAWGTWYRVWDERNDGSTSGLDADLLDGHDTSYFQTALTNPVTGTGTNGYNAYWTGTNTLGSEQYVAVSRGGTGTNTLNNLITLGTHTTGDYVSTITGSGTITSSGATTGESIAHTLSVTADSIGDTQLAFNTGQHLTTTSSPTFAGLTLNGTLALGSNTLTTTNTTKVANLNADLLDGYDSSRILTQKTDLGGAVDLDTIIITGLYHQNANASAAAGTNYPVALAGMLEVIEDGLMVYQKYTQYSSPNTVYVRVSYNNVWSSWQKQFTGSGTQNYIPKFNNAGGTTIGNSLIYDNGTKIGIGTTDPSYKLDILGNTSTDANNTTTNSNFAVETTSNYGIYFRQKGSSAGISGSTFANQIISNSGSAFEIYSTSGQPMILGTNSTEVIRLSGSGLVGIGTTSPTSLLSLGGTAPRTIQMERNTTTATAGQGLTISSGGAIAGTADLAGGDLNLKSGISTGTGSSAIHFFTATAGTTAVTDRTPTEKMTILGNGNVGIGTTTPRTKLELGGDGAILATGTYGDTSAWTEPNLGAGTRMMWYPRKAAFRVGNVSSTEWNDVSIGDYSTAFGNGNTASGISSIAMGDTTTASGYGSTSMGIYTTASAEFSFAMGEASVASGYASTAMGNYNTASGGVSFAIGAGTTASGDVSTAIGSATLASGYNSTSMGDYTTASAYDSLAIGRYNVGGGSGTSWVATDPLFEIGIGTGTGASAANALTVLKNGNVGIGTTSPTSLFSVGSTSQFQVNSTGAIAAATGIASSGTINFSGLTASKVVFTDASKNLTSTGTVGADQGGTGISSYAIGDLLYASGATALSRLAAVAANQPLISKGVNTAPAYAGYYLSGTAAQTYTFPTTTATLARTDAAQTFTGIQTFSSAISAPTSTNTINGLIINSGALSGITTLSMSGQLTSTLATGTAPFVVASTTKVANLNADSLDGYHYDQLPLIRIYDSSSSSASVIPVASRTTDNLPNTFSRVLSGEFKQSSSISYPQGSWTGLLTFASYTGVSSGGAGVQLQLGYDATAANTNNNLYLRTGADTTWGSWTKLWSSSNDGSDSTLDADLLDGQHGSYYMPAITDNWVNISGDTMTGDLTVGSTTRAADTYVRALAGDGYKAGFEAYGNDQGTGYLYAGQNTTYGGGMFYNGDGSPAFATGENADYVSFYRRSAGVNEVVFSYPHSSNDVVFRGSITAGTYNGQTISSSANFTGTVTIASTLNANGVVNLGDGGDAITINSNDWDISNTGAMTGISGIANDSSYTQTGINANTFTGTSTFSNATYSALFTGGNVGIGTATPLTTLEIKSPSSNSVLNVLGIFNQLTGTSAQNNGAAIIMGHTNSSYYNKIATVFENSSPSFLNPALAFYTMYNTNLPGTEVERMRISSIGNVGIGTTNPIKALQVLNTGIQLRLGYDTTHYYDTQVDSSGNVYHMPTSGLNYFNTASLNNTFYIYDYTDGTSSYTTLSGNSFNLRKQGTTAVSLSNNSSGTNYLLGNVGIGTTNPGAKLEIAGLTGAVLNLNTSDDDVQSGDVLGSLVFTARDDSSSDGDENKGKIRVEATTTYSGTPADNSKMVFSLTNGAGVLNDYMTIKSGGNVGIGTTNPLSKLTVTSDINTPGAEISKTYSTAGVYDVLRLGTDSWATANRGLRFQTWTNSTLFNQYLLYNGYATGTTPDFYQGNYERFSGIEFAGGNTNFLVNTGTSGTGSNTSITPTKALTIEYTGEVGIGTTNPGALLDVVNKILLSSDGTMAWGSAAANGRLSWDTSKAIVYARAGNDLSLGANNVWDQLYIKSGGNVGIGTTNPATQLEIMASHVLNSGTTDILTITNKNTNGNGNDSGAIKFQHVDAGNGVSFSPARIVAGKVYATGPLYSGSLLFQTKSVDSSQSTLPTTKMVILENGNVGIGTTSPNTYKLEVSGTGGFTTSVNSPIFQGQAGAVTFGNASYATTIAGSAFTVSPTAWTATPTISGLITATSGLTANGAATFNSTVAFNGGTSGSTAPFTVDSTYLVTNLNADLLDGHDTSYFAAANSKYHPFSNGEYAYDLYTQSNYLRLFTESAAFDTVRFQPYSDIEYWDGSSWVAWTGADTIIQNLLDGRESTYSSIDHTHKKFRFVVTRNSGYPSTALIVLQSTWSAITYPSTTVTVETYNGSAWNVKETALFDSTTTGSNYGLHLKASSNLHNGEIPTRVTIDITDWTDSGSYTTIPLKGFMILSNYSGNSQMPFSWDYNKNMTFAGGINLSANQNLTMVSGTGVFTQSYTGTANANSITSTSTTANNKVLNISQTGATVGTDYAGYFSNTGASTTNIGLYATASGATNNYSAIFDGGNVGIGITNPTYKLDVAGNIRTYAEDGSGLFGISSAAGNIFSLTRQTLPVNGSLAVTAYGDIGFATRKTTGPSTSYDMVISNGSVGVGTTSPNVRLDVLNGTANTSGDSLTASTMTVTGPNVVFGASANNAGVLNIETNDALGANIGGSIGFGGRYSGTGQANFALIKGAKENATSANYASYLSFGTRAQGSQITEQMRINSSGYVGIGTSAPGTGNLLNIKGATPSGTSGFGDGARYTGQLLIESNDAYTTQKGGRIAFSGVAGANGGSFTGLTRQDSVYGTIEGYKENATANHAGGGLLFSTNLNSTGALNERMRITEAGNVGIGITNPLRLLTVNKIDTSTAGMKVASTSVIRVNNAQVGAVGNFAGLQFGFNTNAPDNQVTGMIGSVLTSTANSWAGDLVFGTKATPVATDITEYMRIAYGGKVGIGTTIPNSRLEVLDTAVNTGNSDILTINTNSVVTGYYGSLTFRQSATNIGARITSGNDGSYTGFLAFETSKQTSAGSTTVEAMRIDGTGSVGIGTISPNAKLEVQVPNTAGGFYRALKIGLDSINTNGNGSYIDFGTSNNDLYGAQIGGVRELSAVEGSAMVFRTTGTTTTANEWMRITSTGKVGIGTTNPFQKLTITGDGVGVGIYSNTSRNNWLIKNTNTTGSTSDLTFLYGAPSVDPTTSVMTLQQGTGNVGIGTTSPNSNLEVLKTTNATTNELLRLTNNGTGVNTGMAIKFYSNSDVGQIKSYYNNSWIMGLGTFGNLDTLTLNGGNVGIGTTSPAHRLTVLGGAEIYQPTIGLYAEATSGDSNARNWSILANYTTYGDFGITQSNAKDGNPVSAGTTMLYIKNNGYVGVGTTSPRAKLEVGGDGSFLSTGTYGSGWTEPNLGAGTRMMWYPRKAAFRAGYVNDVQWDNASIGAYSTAFGANTIARGEGSIAIGSNTKALGYFSFASGVDTIVGKKYDWFDYTSSTKTFRIVGNVSAEFSNGQKLKGFDANYTGDYFEGTVSGTPTYSGGYTNIIVTADPMGGDSFDGWLVNLNSTLGGYAATAMGYNTLASGANSVAMGNISISSGNSSVAIGDGVLASGHYSTAMGVNTTASGAISFSIGNETVASGVTSTAMGVNTTASGDFSTAMGYNTTASAYSSFAIGRYNVGGGTAGSWVATDPLFEIGIGTGIGVNSANALTVLKNGNVGIGTTSPRTKLELSGDGAILAIGIPNSGWTEPNLGAGTRMMWYSRKSAFRAGGIDNIQWNDANIGAYSTAFNLNTTASGSSSTAMGYSTTSSGTASTAMGSYTTASGSSSTAMGDSTIASEESSTAMGSYTTASGYGSTAMGYDTTASGGLSFTTGESTTASGDLSTAMGYNTTASAYNSLAIGRYNVGGGNLTTWIATDPLFEIGIGTNSSNKANALTVLKNGNVGIGVTNPTAKLDIVSTSTSGEIFGIRSNTSISSGGSYTYNEYGGYFLANGTDPDGSYGIYAVSNPLDYSAASYGVYGEGLDAGIYGSSDFHGIHGNSTNGIGVYSSSSTGYGIYSEAPKNYFSGNVGIGTTNPATFKLQVSGSVGPNATNSYNLGASGSNWGCLYYNNGTLGTCASDERLKQNVSDIDFGDTDPLTQIAGLRPRVFSFISDQANSMYNGLIAQEVEKVAPNLVITGEDGYKAVKYGDLQWLTLEAVQQLNLNLNTLTGDIVPTEGSIEESFMNKFFENLFVKVEEWLGKADNGIRSIFARKISTKLLCVADEDGVETCIVKSQLDNLLTGLAAGSAGSEDEPENPTPSVNKEAPVINLTGDSTISLNIGDSYTEEGANVTDNKDTFVNVSINGTVDTTTEGTYIITYDAVDTDGNNAIQIKRTVIVNEVTPTSPSTDTPSTPAESVGGTTPVDTTPSDTTSTDTTTTTDTSSTDSASNNTSSTDSVSQDSTPSTSSTDSGSTASTSSDTTTNP